MATTKKPAKKKVSTKAASGGGGGKKGGRAYPPPDDPMARHEEHDVDRVLVEYNGTTGATRMLAAAVAQPIGDSPMLTMAQLRLDAMAATKAMPDHELGGAELVHPLVGADAAHFAAAEGRAVRDGGQTVAPVAGVSNWVQLGPSAVPKGQTYGGARVLITGRVTAIAIHPTAPATIYAGSAQGGVWKTINAGATWDPTSDNELSLAIGALAIDPSNPQVIYAATGEGNFSGDSYYGNGVLKSTNGGASWAMLATPTFAGARFSRIAIDPLTPARLFAATSLGVFRSVNAGVNWTAMTSGIPGGSATDVCIDPTTPTTVYAAVWGQGIYKTTNAGAPVPAWTKLTSGVPATGTFTRVALGISRTAPQTVYALIANVATSNPSTAYIVDRFLTTTNGGAAWTNIPLPGGNIGVQGFYNLNVFVDLTTPNVVYLSGISVWKAVKSGAVWTITQVGANIHPDNHAFAMHPTNPQIVYAGNDGGIYVSTNGGAAWSDSINKGLCITQFEFISNHPTSDAIVIGGTQDNGTEQFRNDAVFYHSDDGDGGFAAISQTGSPNNVLSTYYGNSPKRSTQAGKFGTWTLVNAGILGGGLFYPPMTMDRTNSNNVAFGTDRINLDSNQGLAGWPTKVTLPTIAGVVSAIEYVNSSLIYVGTTSGQVYVLRFAGVWSATKISALPLPAVQINDIAAVPGSPNTIIVVFGGFNMPHVWRGVVSGATAAWTNIDGVGITGIPNIPCDALVIDPLFPNTYYVATDVAVYRSTTGGGTWSQFSTGLPNCAVFDLALQPTTRVLRAATHGRGLWEKKLDVPSAPAVDLYFRDHLMSTARIIPAPNNVPAGFEDPLQYVTLGMPLYIWMCADIKVDSLQGAGPSYQFPVVASVDYLVYESQLQHTTPHRGQVNRVYVQVHNRGFLPGAAVTVKVLYADASAAVPDLPGDFWPNWPTNAFTQTFWHPVGNAKTIATASATQPAIVEFDWPVPVTQATHTCMLVIMDSPSDSIPPINRVPNIWQLIGNEKRVGLKNLQIIDAPPAPPPGGGASWFTLDFHPSSATSATVRLEAGPGVGDVAIVFPKSVKIGGPAAGASSKRRGTAVGTGVAAPRPNIEGFVVKPVGARDAARLKEQLGDAASKYDLTSMFVVPKGQAGRFAALQLPPGGARALVNISASTEPQSWINWIQESNGEIVGGNSYIIVQSKA
jgi:hypothetical protein